MKSKVVVFVWASAVMLGLLAELTYSLPNLISILLPALYMALSFFVFRNLPIGYRVFFLACTVYLILYFALGLVFYLPEILSSKGVSKYLAYAWFSTMNSTYAFFLIILGIIYFPYFIYKKIQASKKSVLKNFE